MATSTKTSTSGSKKRDKKFKSLGLGLEIWIMIFAVIASIPLLNMFALPAILMVFAAGVAVYLLWRSRE